MKPKILIFFTTILLGCGDPKPYPLPFYDDSDESHRWIRFELEQKGSYGKGFEKVTSLSLRFSPSIKDIAPLAGLKNLEYLDISGTGVESLEPLHHLKKLKTLKIEFCGLLSDEKIRSLQDALPECNFVTTEDAMARARTTPSKWNSSSTGKTWNQATDDKKMEICRKMEKVSPYNSRFWFESLNNFYDDETESVSMDDATKMIRALAVEKATEADRK